MYMPSFLFGRFRQVILFLGDIVCAMGALIVTLILRFGYEDLPHQLSLHRGPFTILFILWAVVFFITGLYNLRNAHNNRLFFTRFIEAFILNSAIAIGFFYFIQNHLVSPKTVLFLDLSFTLLFQALWRVIFNTLRVQMLRLAVVGRGTEVTELIEDMKRHPRQGYVCVLHLEECPPNLAELLKEYQADAVTVADNWRSVRTLQKSLFDCITLNIQFYDFVGFYERYFERVPPTVIDRAWFLENINEPGKQFFSLLKRGLDIIFAVIFGVVGIVLFPLVAIAIWTDSGGPILFSQLRVGQFGKPFRIYKLRTLTHGHGGVQHVTRVGRFLRSTHIDELLQVWNIVRGEMSFVGPRPEQVTIVEDLKGKIPFYMERLLVRPGITGWAQLHHPKAQADEALTKLQYDLFYIKNRSLLFDIEIVVKTLGVLLQ